MGFLELSRRLNVLPFNYIVAEALDELSKDIEDYNREQLKEGMRADESFLRNYSKNTTKYNPEKSGHIKLYDTGDFYASIISEANEVFLLINATDWKTKLLTEEFGDSILGLSPPNFKKLMDKLAEKLKVKIAYFLEQ